MSPELWFRYTHGTSRRNSGEFRYAHGTSRRNSGEFRYDGAAWIEIYRPALCQGTGKG